MTKTIGAAARKPGEHRSSAAVRKRILDAAFKIISQYGYSGTTMAKVAAESGLPVGSAYWHFESKDMLLAAVIDASFEKWQVEAAERNKPLPGESFEAHVERIFGGASVRKFIAADFWRLGVILSVEKSVPEQLARQRFMKVRERQRDVLTQWGEQTLSKELLEKDPSLPARLSAFTLAFQDGNAIAGASGDIAEDFHTMLASSLIHLVRQAEAQLQKKSPSSRTRARQRVTDAHP
ncbi:MAG: TetR/AcrR family transcriptional regulator [Aquabacterium sp.]|jgi:AcrR family transcriptional regulator|uniref:TetR/AcrR family transcriptional regulator n=1 Tax=Aquabacterium sp. TaxID=1872578 RepID=UPI002A365933|nr:TetR/AcrR family transcriptional regulator [Aquabacterium sp.]MDX9843963.1 TetR/AcrR family transcriptional regulator [Aquabacterium sp.]